MAPDTDAQQWWDIAGLATPAAGTTEDAANVSEAEAELPACVWLTREIDHLSAWRLLLLLATNWTCNFLG